jgi:hypothetical protein
VVIWYTDLLEIPISHRGLEPHKPMPMTGVPKALDAEPPIASFLKSMLSGGGPVNANVIWQE